MFSGENDFPTDRKHSISNSESDYQSELEDRYFFRRNSEPTIAAPTFLEVAPGEAGWKALFRPPLGAAHYTTAMRAQVIKRVSVLMIGALVLAFSLFIIGTSVYLGSAWKPTTRHLPVLIAQSDPGVDVPSVAPNGTVTYTTVNLGADLAAAILAARTPDGHDAPFADFTVWTRPGVDLLEGGELRRQVVNMHHWSALQIPQNFTLRYLLAMRGLLPDYDNNVTLLSNMGRQQYGSSTLKTYLVSLLTAINDAFALQVRSSPLPFDLNRANIHAVVTPVTLAQVDLYVAPVGTNFMVSMGLLLMWGCLLGLVGMTFSLTEPLEKFVTPFRMANYRILVLTVEAFFLSLTLSLIWLIFGVPFAEGFGAVWMFLWLCACCFESMILWFTRTLGPLVILLSPIIIVFLTLAGSFVPVEMLSSFYSWGYPWPYTHAIEGLRTLVLGTPQCCSTLGLNIGVLFIWGIFFTLIQWMFWYSKIVSAFRRATSPDTSFGKILAGLNSLRGGESQVGG